MLKDKRSSFGVLARIRGLPDCTDELRYRLRELVNLIQSRFGCLSCELIENSRDSTEFTLLEEWSNEKAHYAQLRTEPIQKVMKAVRQLISSELDNRRHVLQSNSVRYAANSYCLAVG
nr:antibiotic biosynthesis monooxygenase [candidate division Zixibacteria bacterium]